MSKRDIKPTDKEIVMRETDFIVSKTDPKGKITYCNKIFIEFSGFQEHELLGIQHNVIRHPDMPRAVFHLLWSHIAQGKEIFAYVKNLCKDGSYYWVIANVTPSVDENGKLLGYYSVRRKPSAKAIPVVTELYKRMLAAEKAAGTKEAIAASTQVLESFLQEQGMSYEQMILSIQAA